MDIALAYNPDWKCCDVVFNGTDFALDPTPASAMLMSILAKRRAAPDDVLPTPMTDWANPASLNARGGYPGDALDTAGQLTGSRTWLLARRLADEQTRQDCENYVAEGLAWLESIRGYALSLLVRYVAPGILGYRARAGNTTVQLQLAVF
ncbi:MAG: hypothetical protein B7Z80_25785 [Rhodospirillales bacterium 20-64-7]|nr:MAG: hypothetical protein B7Z80_25785 [Rhodospirillales bacterium 20-64-7]